LADATTPPADPDANGTALAVVNPLDIVDELRDSYLTYAQSVIISRALPDVRDGLKPSQRRILVAMNDLGLGPASSTSKCAGIIGETMKRYHPHGDASIYDSLVRMAQDWNLRYRPRPRAGELRQHRRPARRPRTGTPRPGSRRPRASCSKTSSATPSTSSTTTTASTASRSSCRGSSRTCW
jgi:hypothetical protein